MNKQRRTTISHVIFDLDGTLLDTEPIYSLVGEEIAQMYGKHFSWEVKSKMMGRNAIESCTAMVEALQLPITPQQLLQLRNQKQDALWGKAQALPGARRLVEHLHAKGIPMAVATGTSKRACDIKVNAHKEWFSCFQAIVTADDPEVKHGKPHPDLFLRAAELLGKRESFETVLVVEDAPLGVEAAINAGMHVVAVPDQVADLSLFLQADSVITSLEIFEPKEWGLPSFPVSEIKS